MVELYETTKKTRSDQPNGFYAQVTPTAQEMPQIGVSAPGNEQAEELSVMPRESGADEETKKLAADIERQIGMAKLRCSPDSEAGKKLDILEKSLQSQLGGAGSPADIKSAVRDVETAVAQVESQLNERDGNQIKQAMGSGIAGMLAFVMGSESVSPGNLGGFGLPFTGRVPTPLEMGIVPQGMGLTGQS